MVRARIVSGSIIFWFRTIGVIIRVIGFPLSSHTLSPLSSVYKVVHVRSGVRRRGSARSGAGGSLLTFCLRLLRCCLFLSKSSSIYLGIWVSDLAPEISLLERSNGSGGDSVSTGFVVTHVGGASAPGGVVASQTPLRRASGELRWILLPRGERCRLWLLDSCSRCFLISNLHCSALVFALCVKVSAFSMEYRLVVYVLFVSVWHWRWTLTAKSVALRFSKTSSVG
ncbi:hypothetical protein F2Q69_00037894 [Brassica cretica]|uniref:Uncharacterized protein n=1 Tax=Brassica cretica TaxID=69181 RepID=A0A8S9SVD0_BRACR|nr:hypothetical protein F2Q69_00037894 [Brassica cretica]